MTNNKIPVGILGATGMVGQRLVTLLANHPWFEISVVAASPKSADKPYREAVGDRWIMDNVIEENIADKNVYAVERDMKEIVKHVSFVFCALDMEKDSIAEIENAYASLDIPVVSSNSANRWTEDVPMILPEVNPDHLSLIPIQQKNRGWRKGFIVVKPNCSIQSYVPLITPLLEYQPQKIIVTTLQAVSGAGKTLASWPEMADNINPFIGGEEQKSEQEPMKIWGKVTENTIVSAKSPVISATCIRVPVSNGHMASVGVSFAKKPSAEQILDAWKAYKSPIDDLHLPSSPKPFITYFRQDDRPQTRLDRMLGNGMGIGVGRLRVDDVLDYKFVGLSHNTIRGAAGGSILTAELLKAKGYIK